MIAATIGIILLGLWFFLFPSSAFHTKIRTSRYFGISMSGGKKAIASYRKIGLCLLLIGIFLFIFLMKKQDLGVACTMEAKICSDGSSVGRMPPSCEFEQCPGE